MAHQWDEFSKSLAEEVPRRESLRRLGAVLAGIVLGPLAAGTARAGGKSKPDGKGGSDPCKAICRCSNKQQQDACLAACRTCTGATSRLFGSCGTGVICADVVQDVRNCGACGNVCQPGPYQLAACVSGTCEYSCVEGAVNCGGECIPVLFDPNNCGACGNVCGELTPYCSWGQCWDADCGGADLDWDSSNCGTCGNVCPPQFACAFGVCYGICYDC